MNDVLAVLVKSVLNATLRQLWNAYEKHPEWRRFFLWVSVSVTGFILAVTAALILAG
jgi:hypothetical protein